MLDPARWPAWLQWVIVVGISLGVFAAQLEAPSRGTLGLILVAIAPGLIGGLIWRFDEAPWPDIASWTVPLTAWVAAVLLLIDTPVRYLIAFGGAGVWLLVFILWLPPVRWWYRHVLRKAFPTDVA